MRQVEKWLRIVRASARRRAGDAWAWCLNADLRTGLESREVVALLSMQDVDGYTDEQIAGLFRRFQELAERVLADRLEG